MPLDKVQRIPCKLHAEGTLGNICGAPGNICGAPGNICGAPGNLCGAPKIVTMQQ